MYKNYNENNIWNGYLNEMRHDVIAKQAKSIPTDADIELIGRIIYYVTDFAKSARNYGLLAMEEEASYLDLENQTEAVLHEAVELIVDGCSQECVAEVLSNKYWVSRMEGGAAIAVYIGIRGALLVQEGTHPYSVQRIVSSMLPAEIKEKCMEVCHRYEAEKKEKQNEIAKAYFETDFSRSEGREIRGAIAWLEREIFFMKDVEIQRLLQEVDNNYLVPALIGMKKKARQAIARNMSVRLREMIMEECYQLADIDDCGIEEGVMYVTEKLKMLQACGEIMDAESRLLYS